MPELVEGSTPPKIEFIASLPHSLLATISLLCAVPHFEGLGDWLLEIRSRMSTALRDELCLLVSFPGQYQRVTAELFAQLPENVSRLDFDGLMGYLQAIPAVEYEWIALRALARGATPRPDVAVLRSLMDQPDAWSAYLSGIESEVAPEVVASLVRHAENLKSRLLTSLDRFWQDVYAQEFQLTRPLMERSVAFHSMQPYGPNFRDLFVSVTGRLVPETITDLLPGITRVSFVPSCYVGPYVAYTYYGDHLILFYNCRSAPAGVAALDGTALYPPLKALADETRLQILALLRGRELYAQEIVEQLDISQPAVSRHLNLMVAAGVLRVRQEGNIKYYSIDGQTIARLAAALRGFAGAS
jgi:hypothetical protein